MILVYLVHSTSSGKYYVGWTSKTFAERWSVHLDSAKHGAKW